jgi:hypothetical protein|tara:strand:- start:478 stop:711 length:234 start_codon:yes stop_codon:yes gene_type:complete
MSINNQEKEKNMKYKSTIFVTNPIGRGEFTLISKVGKTEQESYDNVIESFESREFWKYPNTSWIEVKDIVKITTTQI